MLAFMNMKRFVALIAAFVLVVPLFASFTIVIPGRGDIWYSVMAENGEILPLDDSVYYKRWNGILAENLADGIYMVTDNDTSCVVIMGGVSEDALDLALNFYSADTVIIPRGMKVDPEILGDASVRDAILLSRLSDLEKRLYENEGISVHYSKPGELIDIIDGRPALEDSGKAVLVTCPDCGREFTEYSSLKAPVIRT